MSNQLPARIQNKIVANSSGCQDWTAALDHSGYGIVFYEGTSQHASRAIYKILVGPIPEGMHVLHTCDRPICVNITHLFLGTHDDNMKDMAAKGRMDNHGARNPKAKLCADDVREIRKRAAMGEDRKTIANDYGVGSHQVWQIVKRVNWAWLDAEIINEGDQ